MNQPLVRESDCQAAVLKSVLKYEYKKHNFKKGNAKLLSKPGPVIENKKTKGFHPWSQFDQINFFEL